MQYRLPSLNRVKEKLFIISMMTLFFLVSRSQAFSQGNSADFQAGAAVVDVTPVMLPVIVNGGMVSRSVGEVKTLLKARGLAFSDGKKKVVLVIVDSCMMPRPLLDEVKQMASNKTGIPTDHIMISATHTHSAGSCMGALGTPADENYVPFLRIKLVETIETALQNLEPAQVGFAKVNAAEFTALRRWIRRPDRIVNDPFGNPTVRANMHSAKNLDDVTGESGPEDPDLSLISVQTKDGKPLAVLANFSMHYFAGERGLSADYFGLFSEGLKKKIAPDSQFVGMMSHGCSGDIWRRDYAQPDSWEKLSKIDEYSAGLIDKALIALEKVKYKSNADLSMAEQHMELKYRVPDKQLLKWSTEVVQAMGDRLPKTKEEIYAKEQVILHTRQKTEIVTQAIRIGDIAIATTPNETYAITGLKIKAKSPLENTMVIELANGGDGYIPPPEQHLFGGYNTWAARSAGLEVMAEPKITESCVNLLEKVCDAVRREPVQTKGSAASTIENLKPLAWYRLDEFNGPRAVDSSGNHHSGIYESEVTYYLAGPHSKLFNQANEVNRCAMFAGGRLCSSIPNLGREWSVSLWIWNGMPKDGRKVSGYFLSQGNDYGLSKGSVHFGIGGSAGGAGRLIFQSGNDEKMLGIGKTEIPRWEWQHVVVTRSGKSISLYLNGEQEFEVKSDSPSHFNLKQLFFGGRSDNQFNWEGRLDEISIYNRLLSEEEIKSLSVSK
jgi:hypothetical protein